MKKILLLGAGRSASSLISYLLDNAPAENWEVAIGDINVAHLQPLVEPLAFAKTITFDVHDTEQRAQEVNAADLVISLLPAVFHIEVAKECLAQEKHLITASYVSAAFLALHEEAQQKNLTILMESGLDPGIDHMSAMRVIRSIKAAGGKLTTFKSYTGGLVAPESDNNPWNYKFTWNPRNVVLAGQGTAKYIKKGQYKYIPYHKLFKRTDTFYVEGYGHFEGYANRDSLSYREPYELLDIPTMLRGTLRRQGYCEAWDVFVQLGLTDDSYDLDGSDQMTYRTFVEAFLPPASAATQSMAERISLYLGIPADGDVMQKLEWLGLFEETPVALAAATPAQILEKILKEKWTLAPGDKDMIVMQHQFGYTLNGEQREVTSTLVAKGDDEVQTAMAKTVGLPVGILAKLLLQGKITRRGVVIPIFPELYEPVLDELEAYGIRFVEKEVVGEKAG
ncbi:saccharopine dehydrogenase C-terminal domain-containing protein [Pontibacter akesuensis]|uniref:Saccharopine dehydrogenase NADP binding domain-containing protein n=1 Tax=Pontibacter akesuensis TaxID=388950 RepID=A0A1I7J447_9BACT|nr:saccharopine dehydrogenase C-terminal domain-containing protein [Pontibacter akesuensis]GHA72528.1 saccharopine dehydrogenase [Pontibacter akesuensis]SFU79934.1 Saccharopine dehydrogenase NADP binding domain-containing protein [Pontibacter akesuensis]